MFIGCSPLLALQSSAKDDSCKLLDLSQLNPPDRQCDVLKFQVWEYLPQSWWWHSNIDFPVFRRDRLLARQGRSQHGQCALRESGS